MWFRKMLKGITCRAMRRFDAKCERGATLPNGVTAVTDVPYGEDKAETLDFYYPDGGEDLPLIVDIHGGAGGRKAVRSLRNERGDHSREHISRAAHSHTGIACQVEEYFSLRRCYDGIGAFEHQYAAVFRRKFACCPHPVSLNIRDGKRAQSCHFAGVRRQNDRSFAFLNNIYADRQYGLWYV